MKPHHHIKIARSLAHLLDNQFSIFGLKFGFDPVLGLIPWLGDAISAALAFYMIIIAKRLNMEQKHINKMISHIILDLILGIIPIVGTVGDFFYKANSRNLKILEKHLEEQEKIIEGELAKDSTIKIHPQLTS